MLLSIRGAALHPFVCDFGVSKSDASATLVNATVVGTPGFMAPEVLRDSQFSSRSDVYSFGVLLLTLATGRAACRNEGLGNLARTVPLADDVDVDRRPAAEQAARGVTWETPAALDGLLRLARHCTRSERRERPSMDDAMLALADLRSEDGGPSEFYKLSDMVTTVATPLVCLICEERPRDTVFMPCLHAATCGPCADLLASDGAGGVFKCPICRAQVKGTSLAVGTQSCARSKVKVVLRFSSCGAGSVFPTLKTWGSPTIPSFARGLPAWRAAIPPATRSTFPRWR